MIGETYLLICYIVGTLLSIGLIVRAIRVICDNLGAFIIGTIVVAAIVVGVLYGGNPYLGVG